MYPPCYAILIDGAFVITKLIRSLGRFPKSDDVVEVCNRITEYEPLKQLDLMRIYFYHAPPAEGSINNPIDKSRINLTDTEVYRYHRSLLDKLEVCPNFALRLGDTINRGWRLGSKAMKNLTKKARPLQGNDLVPNIVQKGVDLRIGLDIARLSLQRMVRVIVVATGDSDLVPAFKFARREGVRVYLDHMEHSVRRELKIHADIVLDLPIKRNPSL